MPDDEVAVDSESASDEAASEDPTESTSEEQGDESADESGVEPQDEETGESGESESEEGQQEASDDEDPEYRNLVAKFAHITNPRDRNAAIARAFWEKTRYDSRLRKENEALKLEIAKREAREPKKEEPPPPPPPDLDKAIKKIEALYQRGQSLQSERQEVVKDLNAADREVAIAEDRLKDTTEDDERRPLAMARLRQAKLELEAARGRYRGVNERMETLEERLETAMAEKDWIERFHKDQQQRQQTEQQRAEAFNEQFPQQVEGLVAAAAKHINLKVDNERLQASLWRHVNRALQADMRGQYLETDIEDIPVPQMVLDYVKEWAEDRDLTHRKDFTETSKAKLSVASRATTPSERKAPGAAPKPVPASLRPPVPVALLSRDSTPTMAKARRLLVQRLGPARG